MTLDEPKTPSETTHGERLAPTLDDERRELARRLGRLLARYWLRNRDALEPQEGPPGAKT